MPSKGTPRRTIRIADEIWDAAEQRAQSEGRELADVIREHLALYGVWDPAQQRAAREGRELLDVIHELVATYGKSERTENK